MSCTGDLFAAKTQHLTSTVSFIDPPKPYEAPEVTYIRAKAIADVYGPFSKPSHVIDTV
jgi:hypothetical protein